MALTASELPEDDSSEPHQYRSYKVMADAPHDMLSSNTPTDIKCSQEIKDDAIQAHWEFHFYRSQFMCSFHKIYMVLPRNPLQNAL